MKKCWISLFVLAGFFAFAGCQNSTTIPSEVTTTTTNLLEYSDFPDLILTSPDEQLAQVEDDYYLYFYGPICEHCTLIKGEVLAKLSVMEMDKVYLVEADSLDDIHDEISLTKTPGLVHIVMHEVDSVVIGMASVMEIIRQLE